MEQPAGPPCPFDKSSGGLFNSSQQNFLKQETGRENTMKLYDSVGPNPRIVRMFMAEKGIEIPKQAVDLRKGENREAEHLKRNPHGQMPTLELDNGNYVSEITAICEYLEEKNPNPPLIGSTPEERAECRMWTRRIDLNICEHMGNGFRFGEGLKFFEKRIACAPEASPGLKMIAANRLQWLNNQMADGRQYISGKRFTLADILLYGWLDFAGTVGQPLDTANTNIVAWMARVGNGRRRKRKFKSRCSLSSPAP
jgi:glutathione S-transferase